MLMTDSIVNFRRYLKRRNRSLNTAKNYINRLKQFVVWVDEPIENVETRKILEYIDHLIDKHLKPQTINSHLGSIRRFYNYLHYEEGIRLKNPVKKGMALRLSDPLPKHLKDAEVISFFDMIKKNRDRAMFMLMLRCGLRVDEVASLTLDALDFHRKRLFVFNGKGGKGRMVYMSNDTQDVIVKYLNQRQASRVKKVFLVEKGAFKNKPISVRGIQKRIEYYSRKSGIKASCHQLRHTMATQLLNADADLVTIQDLLGHSRIKTTQRYCRVSNIKVERDYHEAMSAVMHR